MRTTVRAPWDPVRRRSAAANQICDHLQLAFPAAINQFADIDSAVTNGYVILLWVLYTQIAALEENLAAQRTTHPDAHNLAPLTKGTPLRVVRLIAEIGDARCGFSIAASLSPLAGVAPSNRQSGKVKAVAFRWGSDIRLRGTLRDFAGDSRHAKDWAIDIYKHTIARGHDNRRVVPTRNRVRAHVIWHCWHDNLSYDRCQYRAVQNILARSTAKAT